MKPFIYVRTELEISGVGSTTHVAELQEIDANSCEMIRLIELSPDETIMGIFGQGIQAGAVMQPEGRVPHPNTYQDFPDITATFLEAPEFEALWAEGVARLA